MEYNKINVKIKLVYFFFDFNLVVAIKEAL